LSELKIGMIQYIRKIGHGQLLPEVVLRLAFNQNLLRRVSNYPLPDQRKVIECEAFRVVRIEDGKMVKTDPLPAHLLTKNDIAQVFDMDHIRDEEEQFRFIRARNQKVIPEVKPDIEVNAKGKYVVINGKKITQVELVALLSRITG